jgi:hypothetical protein
VREGQGRGEGEGGRRASALGSLPSWASWLRRHLYPESILTCKKQASIMRHQVSLNTYATFSDSESNGL